MRTRVFVAAIIGVLGCTVTLAEEYILKQHLLCVLDNAKAYQDTPHPFVIIVLDRCPDPGDFSELIRNQLPRTDGMKNSVSEHPNVLVYSKEEFRCLIDYWRGMDEIPDKLLLALSSPCDQ